VRPLGRHDEASRLLSDIYGWFTEGFDTQDLKSAKGLAVKMMAVGDEIGRHHPRRLILRLVSDVALAHR
jgi:hypothetical protein